MPGQMPSARVLLVEGGDEEHFLREWRKRIGTLPDFDVRRRQGFSDVIKGISSALKESGRVAVGAVLDANGDVESRWAEISAQLKVSNTGIPEHPDPNGTVWISPLSIRIGIWLMPDNQSPGEFEHFVRKLIPNDDDALSLADRYVADVVAVKMKFETAKMTKAQIRAWLAVQREPGLLGQAVRTGDLDLTAETLRDFQGWLERTFPISP